MPPVTRLAVIRAPGFERCMYIRVPLSGPSRAAQFFNACRSLPRDHPGCFHAQDRAQAFPAGKDAVAHRLMDGFGPLGGGWKEFFQGLVYRALALVEDFLEHEDVSIT